MQSKECFCIVRDHLLVLGLKTLRFPLVVYLTGIKNGLKCKFCFSFYITGCLLLHTQHASIQIHYLLFSRSFPRPAWMVLLASYLPRLKSSVIVTFSLVPLLTFKALFLKLFSHFLSPSHYYCPVLVQHFYFFFIIVVF